MSDVRLQTAIEFVGSDVVVTRIKPSADGVMVEHSERLTLPAQREGDEKIQGKALREALAGAGLPTRRAVLVFSRSAVMLRPVEVPESALDSDELSDIVRLRFERRATVAAEHELVLDYLPAREGDGSVLACAVRRGDLEFSIARLKAAGIRCDACVARGATLAPLADAESGDVQLVATLTPLGADLALVHDGRLVHAGAVIGRDAKVVGDAIAVEVDRVLMSPWFGNDRLSLSLAKLVADDERAPEVAERLSRRLGVEVATALPPILRSVEGDLSGLAVTHAACLVASNEHAAVGFDFLNPRKAPDTKAARRRVGMLAGLLAIGVLGAGWFMIDYDLSSLRKEVSGLTSTARDMTEEHRQHQRETARIQHLERLTATDRDVSEALAELHGMLPGPGPILLDGVRWTQERGVEFRAASSGSGAARRRAFTGGSWVVAGDERIGLSASTRDRSAMIDVREALLASERYDLRTRAADIEDRLELDLRVLEEAAGGEE